MFSGIELTILWALKVNLYFVRRMVFVILNRLFASGITQNKYGEIKMRSVGEDDIV